MVDKKEGFVEKLKRSKDRRFLFYFFIAFFVGVISVGVGTIMLLFFLLFEIMNPYNTLKK